MKTNTALREVETSGVESGVFTIQANGKAFKGLIDGLYADKPQSITREIWSNALDAHVMAGKADQPFDVSFPSIFDPTFRVRDYGIGLSHSDVMNLYTTLFQSTKEDTDSQVGKFGLGSKSPFSYTDTFMVTSWFNNEKRYYTATIGEDYIPTINLMGIEPTTEPNGIEVAFPVERQDVRAFSDAARRISFGYVVKPTVTNSNDFKWPTYKEASSGKGWKLLSSRLEGYQETSYACMGSVIYPININAIADLDSAHKELLRHPFLIDFPVGSLEVTMSRESLSYGRNEPTQDAIKNRIKVISDEIFSGFDAKYKAAKNYQEACNMFTQDMNNYNIPNYVRSQLQRNGASWNGMNLTKSKSYSKRDGVSFCQLTIRQSAAKYLRHSYSYGMNLSYGVETPVFYIEYLNNGLGVSRAASRIQEHFEKVKAPNKYIVWVKVTEPRTATPTLMEMAMDFDAMDFVEVNTLPAPPAVKRNPRAAVKVRKLTGTNYVPVDISDEEIEDGGLYIKLERMSPCWPANLSMSPMTLYHKMGQADSNFKQVVYAVPKSLWKKFEGPQWVDFHDYAKSWAKNAKVDIGVQRAEAKFSEKLRSNEVLTFVKTILRDKAGVMNSPHITDKHPLSQLISIAESFTARYKKTTTPSADLAIVAIKDTFGIPSDINGPHVVPEEALFDASLENLKTLHPIISLAQLAHNSSYYSANTEVVNWLKTNLTKYLA